MLLARDKLKPVLSTSPRCVFSIDYMYTPDFQFVKPVETPAVLARQPVLDVDYVEIKQLSKVRRVFIDPQVHGVEKMDVVR